MSAPPPNKKKAPERRQRPEPEKQQQKTESSEPSGLDPAPLLEKYARYGVYLKWLWPMAAVSFVVAAIFIFSTIPGNYKALQPGQHITDIAVHPADTSLVRLWLMGNENIVIQSTDGGKYYTTITNTNTDSTIVALEPFSNKEDSQ